MIFYKNSGSLNVYSRLTGFSLGASTYSNLSKFALGSFLWAKRMIHPLYSYIWLQWKYWKYGGTDDFSSVRKAFKSHFCLFLPQCNMMICLWLIQYSHFIQWAHEDCTTYKGISSYFVMIAKTDSNFLNIIYIARAIHSLCPGESDKQMVSLFLCFN